ncbi:unnamed protein product [Trichobilharzia szidati]|nr:unnamed protein product [Trichobilharzia szidati]
MKLYFALILLIVCLAYYGEAKQGRVKCSAQCWEKGIRCQNGCRNDKCRKNCQAEVPVCIRDVCRVSEHVDTFEEHQQHD